MSFELRLKRLQYEISLDPFRWLFVAREFAWKTKKTTRTKTNPNTMLLLFSMVELKTAQISIESRIAQNDPTIVLRTQKKRKKFFFQISLVFF